MEEFKGHLRQLIADLQSRLKYRKASGYDRE